jgi:hypothetical protein
MILKDQKIHIEAQKPFSIIREGLPYMKTKIALLEPNENISIKGKEAACAASHPTLLGRRDSNPRIVGPEPTALPLGYSPEFETKQKSKTEISLSYCSKNFKKDKGWQIKTSLNTPAKIHPYTFKYFLTATKPLIAPRLTPSRVTRKTIGTILLM